jgi:Na+-driven multidrug efflux pump
MDNIRSFKIDYELQKTIFNIGIPSSIESLMFNGGKLISQIFIVNMGVASIAANAIALSFASLINIPGSAFSIVAPTLVGQSMGRGKSEEAKNSLIYVTILSSFCLFVLCAVSFPLTNLISSLYTQNKDVIHITSLLIRFTAIITPLFWSVSFVLPSGLNGAGDTKYTMVTSVIGMWAFRIILGYLFGVVFKLGVFGIWMGMHIDWILRGTLYCFRLKSGKWKNNVVIKSMDEAVIFK